MLNLQSSSSSEKCSYFLELVVAVYFLNSIDKGSSIGKSLFQGSMLRILLIVSRYSLLKDPSSS